MVDVETGEHNVNNSEMAVGGGAGRPGERGHRRVRGRPAASSRTASPDYLLPPMVTFVQEALGLERCATVEVRSGCAGFGEALDIARLYLESGHVQHGAS